MSVAPQEKPFKLAEKSVERARSARPSPAMCRRIFLPLLFLLCPNTANGPSCRIKREKAICNMITPQNWTALFSLMVPFSKKVWQTIQKVCAILRNARWMFDEDGNSLVWFPNLPGHKTGYIIMFVKTILLTSQSFFCCFLLQKFSTQRGFYDDMHFIHCTYCMFTTQRNTNLRR